MTAPTMINTADDLTPEERAAIISAAAEARKRSDKFTAADIRYYIGRAIRNGTAGNIRGAICNPANTKPAAYTGPILSTGLYATYENGAGRVTYCDPDYLKVRKKHNQKPVAA